MAKAITSAPPYSRQKASSISGSFARHHLKLPYYAIVPVYTGPAASSNTALNLEAATLRPISGTSRKLKVHSWSGFEFRAQKSTPEGAFCAIGFIPKSVCNSEPCLGYRGRKALPASAVLYSLMP